MPAAAIAPAITAGHWTYDVDVSAAMAGGTPVALILPQPEEGQDGDDDDHETNQIDDAVHVNSRLRCAGGTAGADDGSRDDIVDLADQKVFSPFSRAAALREASVERHLSMTGDKANGDARFLDPRSIQPRPIDFPVVTCIVVSVVLSLPVWILRR